VRKMLVGLAIAIALGPFNARVAHSDEEPGLASLALHAGAKALEFRVDKDVFLKPSSGASLAYRTLSSPDRGWRLNLDLRLSAARGESSTQDVIPPDTSGTPNAQVSHSTNQSYTVGLERLMIFQPNGRAVGLFATGPTVTFARSSGHVDGMGAIGTVEQGVRTWEVGWTARIGVEVFATRHLAFASDYGLAAMYMNTHVVGPAEEFGGVVSVREAHNVAFAINSTGVKLDIIVYFK
jgi:hypothetical protein